MTAFASDRDVALGCVSCDVDATVSLEDPDLPRRAVAFFTRHEQCLTRVDVPGMRRMFTSDGPAE